DGDLPKAISRGSEAGPESPGRTDVDERGGRRAEVAVLSVVGEHECERDHSVELLHGLGGVRALSQGYLRAVEELGASLRVVQQPVLPEIGRVHAVGS